MGSNISLSIATTAQVENDVGQHNDLSYRGAKQLLSKERVVINLEAPGWVVMMFFCWSKFIQKSTGATVRIRVFEDARGA
ncbi:hypothetical protein CPB83DRAFT_688042 [Crepidotus variabilis]|uniref:Uncharacterized protein n=1 Tax=Crepidotus variabilis TaxID=179855 RepID=A0A9P6E6M3_9AGAR|nr:hypothetical protein CPB83DRAFT_688042 [Crepidotus variabilis]